MICNGILQNGNIPIAKIRYDTRDSSIKSIKVIDECHMPINTMYDGKVKMLALEILKDRSIPAERQNLKRVLERLNVISRFELSNQSFGLSLSDQYWINPTNLLGKPLLKWENVNFFTNNFSHDVGDLFFNDKNAGNIDLIDPVNTSDGVLRKVWIISNGERYLLKAGDVAPYQEPFNEVIASRILQHMGFNNYLPYTLAAIHTKEGPIPVSACKCFCNEHTECVPLTQALTIGNAQCLPHPFHFNSALRNVLETYHCDKEEADRYFDNLNVLDYIIMNKDRHTNNICFLRDTNTPDWLKLGPIFDSGNSLLYSVKQITTDSLNEYFNGQITSYRGFSSFEEFVEHVNPDNININALYGIEDIVKSVLAQSKMSEERIEFVCAIVKERQDMLRECLIKRQQNPNKYIPIPTYSVPNINNTIIGRDDGCDRTR